MLQGHLPYRIKEFHDKYGSVIRVAPGELSFIDEKAWKDIYSNRTFLRPPQWGNRPPGVEAHNVISAPLAEHTRFRKVLGPAFSEKAVRLQETFVMQYVDLLIKKLRQNILGNEGKSSGIVDIVEWINFCTFDIISDLGWGASFKCLEKQEYHPWVSHSRTSRSLIREYFLWQS